MKQFIFFLILLFSDILLAKDESIVKSIYTLLINDLSETQLSKYAEKISNPNDKISLKCLETQEGQYYIGLAHSLTINSPAKEVASIIETFNQYPVVFEGIEDAKIMKKMDLENIIVEFENKSPAFFIPNIRYQMEYKIIPTHTGKIYKYHLSNLLPQKDILFSDGVMFLEEKNGVTRFYEIDFFNANWGLAEKIAGSRIWHDSIKELVISDFELKLKAENLNMTVSEKKNKIKNLIDDDQIEKCIQNKLSVKNFH